MTTYTTKTKQAANSSVEPYYFAIRALAVGSSDLRNRLREAALHIVTLNESAMPLSVQQNHNKILANLTVSTSATDEGNISATLDTMSPSQMVTIAELIFFTYCELQSLRGFSAV